MGMYDRDDAIASAMGMSKDDELYREMGEVARQRIEAQRQGGEHYWRFRTQYALRRRLIRAGIAVAALTFVSLIVLGAFAARSEEASTACPPSAKSCKVLVLTPEEEQALMQPRGVLDTAREGRPLDLGQIVSYFRERISRAPAGVVPPEAVPVPRPRPSEAPKPEEKSN